MLRLFDSLPFVDATDRAAMLAALLTAIQRRLLPAAPLMAITAPTPGTGKTLLCETLALVGGSGSGKSTLGRAIAGLGSMASGLISWQGEALACIWLEIQWFRWTTSNANSRVNFSVKY